MEDEEFIVAVYHLVFRMSGLPAALPRLAEASLGLVADLNDWHQLDHYTAAFVVLDAAERPVALTLQQHNYLRTYLVGESVEPGRDGRFDIDVAIRSNELYPHVAKRRRHRAVRFLSPEAAAFMMGYGTRPMMSADDVTDPDRTVDLELAFLPGTDAFYTFQGHTSESVACCLAATGRRARGTTRCRGSSRCRPRSSGATGARRNEGDWQRYRRSRERSDDPAEFSRAQTPVFHRNLACVRRGMAGCTLQ